MAPKKAQSKKQLVQEKPEEPEPTKEESPITPDIIEKRAELTQEWFRQQVEKTISDNQAHADAVAAEEQAKADAEAEQRRLDKEERDWKQSMAELRERVESRLEKLTQERVDREKFKETAVTGGKSLLAGGMRMPTVAKLLPIVLLSDTHTTTFHERYFIRQLVKLLEHGGIHVWWDFREGLSDSPDLLLNRMEVANRAQVILIVGTKGYFDGPLFDAEAELLYSRSVGGYSNNVKDLKVLHIAYEEATVPEKWRSSSGGLSFSTNDPLVLPPLLPDSSNWLERARIGASLTGSAVPHMLTTKAAFFLSIASASSCESVIRDANERPVEPWEKATKPNHARGGLFGFQRRKVAEWSREDMILAMSWLGAVFQKAAAQFMNLGMDGWLLEVVDDVVLQQCGVSSAHQRTAILELLDRYREIPEALTDRQPVLALEDLDSETLSEEVQRMFMAGDRNGDGKLDQREFKEILIASRLELKPAEIRLIMAEVDENCDGTIDYDEFLPVMVSLFMGIKAQREAALSITASDEKLQGEAVKQVAGMQPPELNYKLRELFAVADGDANGFLTRAEFLECVKSDKLNLTRRQINVMMGEFDEDPDGNLTYEEFVPIAIDVLLESSKNQLEDERLTVKAKGMELLLNKAFKRLEPPGFCSNGRVKTCVAKALLICMAHARVVELGSVHIASIMQAVDPFEKGMVSCSRFSFLAASMIDAYYSSGEIMQDAGILNRQSMKGRQRLWRSVASRQNIKQPVDGLGRDTWPRRGASAKRMALDITGRAPPRTG